MSYISKIPYKNTVLSVGFSHKIPKFIQRKFNLEPKEIFKYFGNFKFGGYFSAESDAKEVNVSAAITLPNIKKIARSVLSTIFDSGYIDMGLFEQLLGNSITWSSKDYPLGFYDTQKLDANLDTIFDPLAQKDGTKKINLSFAQICNIAAILNPNLSKSYSGTDKILEILTYNPNGNNPAFNKPIVQNGKKLDVDILQYVINYANSKSIKVDLSFGGSVATNNDYKIGDPVKAANDLVAFMDKYNIDSVDFDIENVPGLMTNGEATVLSFFKTLHSALATQNKKVYLTLIGSTSQGPTGALKPIFDDFDACADGVRLMLYSTSQFYIDANNTDWGLNVWKNIVKDPTKMSIGFYDKIAYENPQSSDPAYSADKYKGFPSNPTRGQAAAWIYVNVLSEMGLTADKLDLPFWWTDSPMNIPDDQFLEDFYKYLNQYSKELKNFPNIEISPKIHAKFS